MTIDPQQLRLAADILEARQAGREVKWQKAFRTDIWQEGRLEDNAAQTICNGWTIRLAPWSLPLPPEGKSWHRGDEATEAMLPVPYRLLFTGEILEEGDERLWYGEWEPAPTETLGVACFPMQVIFRTRRPAVPPQPVVRAWSRETLPELPFEVRHKQTGNRYSVLACDSANVAVAGAEMFHSQLAVVSFGFLFDFYTRRDGSPCGTTEASV